MLSSRFMSLMLGLGILFVCLLLASALVAGTGLPVAPPVLGMFLLILLLARLGELPTSLERASAFLLRYLTLMFVPAGVGAMLYFEQLRGEWLALLVTLVLSTVIAMAATAWLLNKLLIRAERQGGGGA